MSLLLGGQSHRYDSNVSVQLAAEWQSCWFVRHSSTTAMGGFIIIPLISHRQHTQFARSSGAALCRRDVKVSGQTFTTITDYLICALGIPVTCVCRWWGTLVLDALTDSTWENGLYGLVKTSTIQQLLYGKCWGIRTGFVLAIGWHVGEALFTITFVSVL
jgi:hypothetical protein